MLLLLSLLSAEEVIFKYTADSLLRLYTSTDASKWGFWARKAGKRYVIINGQEWGPYDDAEDLSFPKDGSATFYVARKTDKIDPKTLMPEWEIIRVTVR